MKKRILFISLLLGLSAFGVSAQEELSSFKSLIRIDGLDIKVPTVIEIPLQKEDLETPYFAVLEDQNGRFQPYYYYSDKKATPYEIFANDRSISDKLNNSQGTFAEFEVPAEGLGRVSIRIEADQEIDSDSIILFFDKYIAMPINHELIAMENGREKIIIAKSKMNDRIIRFPGTSAKTWILNLEYIQPLRITGLIIDDKTDRLATSDAIRFLARPSSDYIIYLNADRYPDIKTTEGGDLTENKNVRKLKSQAMEANPVYQKSDYDKDGIIDEIDNCVNVANPDQKDIDNNSRGDACDDYDRDGLINSSDNCPDHPNKNQQDDDGDKIGNPCDSKESRLTESLPWLPWLGISATALVIGFLFFKTLKEKK